jgi:hypothetical protein
LLSFILGHKSLRSSEEFTPAVAETQQKSFWPGKQFSLTPQE